MRNGHHEITVKTTAGPVRLARPKLRGTTEVFASRLLGAGVSKSNALESLVIAGFVRGLSVRDVEATLAEALGAEAALSKSSVSRICQAIAEQFDTWRTRRLDLLSLDYLFLDGSHFKMHPGSPAEPILAGWGISTDGKPVLVALEVAASEGSDAWDGFLDGLADRGLRPPLLVISDGAAGLIGAIERNLPHALRQRCLIHRARNLLAKVPKNVQDEVKAAYWAIFDVPDNIAPGQAAVDWAQKQIDAFAARYGKRLPAAVRCLLDDRAALTPYLRFPFPRTIQGQADAIQRVFQAANDIVNNRGTGVLTWEPASFQTMFRAVPGQPNMWEPHASINVYNASRARHILEDTIYTSTVAGAAPKLPTSIQVLTTADGRIAALPVRWQPLPPGAADAPGKMVVTGMTDAGAVTAVVDIVKRPGHGRGT